MWYFLAWHTAYFFLSFRFFYWQTFCWSLSSPPAGFALLMIIMMVWWCLVEFTSVLLKKKLYGLRTFLLALIFLFKIYCVSVFSLLFICLQNATLNLVITSAHTHLMWLYNLNCPFIFPFYIVKREIKGSKREINQPQ